MEFYLVAVVFSEKEYADVDPYEAHSIWEDEVNSAYQHDAEPPSPSTDVKPCLPWETPMFCRS